MLDHGGNLDVARERFGGRLEDWIDLSTGINRRPYPIGELQPWHWTALPSRAEIASLYDAARLAYGTTGPILATAGAHAAAHDREAITHGTEESGNRHRILCGLKLRPTGREPVGGDHGCVQ